MDHITPMLDALATLQAQHASLQAEHAAAREAALPETVRQALAAIDGTYLPQLDGMALELAQLTEQVKAAVLAHGRSVKGAGLQAIYVNGRVSWADDFLQGYAATHPEILQARVEGQPSVSLRKAR